MHLPKPHVARRDVGDVLDPVAERVGLRGDTATLGERHLEALPFRNREDGAAADKAASQSVGFAWPVADRDVDRDPAHIGERLERRADVADQARLEEPPVRKDDGNPAALASIDPCYAFRHSPSLTGRVDPGPGNG